MQCLCTFLALPIKYLLSEGTLFKIRCPKYISLISYIAPPVGQFVIVNQIFKFAYMD